MTYLCHILRGFQMPMIILKLNHDIEGYSEPCQTSKMEHFGKIVNGFWAVNYFPKTLHLICLTGLWMCFKQIIIWSMFCSDRRYSAIISIRRRQLNFLLYGQSTELFRVGRSVCKIIIIMLSFRVGTCTNKIIDNEVKEMYYYVNTSDIWNRPHLFTSRFNNIKCTNLFFFLMCFIVI